jgi:hypothetical protein
MEYNTVGNPGATPYNPIVINDEDDRGHTDEAPHFLYSDDAWTRTPTPEYVPDNDDDDDSSNDVNDTASEVITRYLTEIQMENITDWLHDADIHDIYELYTPLSEYKPPSEPSELSDSSDSISSLEETCSRRWQSKFNKHRISH